MKYWTSFKEESRDDRKEKRIRARKRMKRVIRENSKKETLKTC